MFLSGFVAGFITALLLIIGVVILPIILGAVLVIGTYSYYRYKKALKRREEALREFWEEKAPQE